MRNLISRVAQCDTRSRESVFVRESHGSFSKKNHHESHWAVACGVRRSMFWARACWSVRSAFSLSKMKKISLLLFFGYGPDWESWIRSTGRIAIELGPNV